MWQAGEIVQGDSGQVVSNKLDAEFQRLQTWGENVDNSLSSIVYTTDVTIFNKTLAEDIVTPYTFWYALDPQIAKITQIKLSTDHMKEKLFDGTYWIRSDAMFEYSGAYRKLESLADGYMITKAHIDEFGTIISDTYIKQDGSNGMSTGYVPSNTTDVATKGYVDDIATALDAKINSDLIEYPASSLGDTTFSATLKDKTFIVIKNGIIQRTNKYSYNDTSFSFVTGLDDDDEITLLIVGDA